MAKPTETVPSLLSRHIPRPLVLAVEEALTAGAARAYAAAEGMQDGHLPHVVGQLRHFHMNEAFHQALALAEAQPTALRGNTVVTGRTGVVTLARFNIPEGFWVNGRRSKTRRQMALANSSIEPLVQHGLFTNYAPPADAVAFFVACFSGSIRVQPEGPVSIQIAVPNPQMTGWLYRAPLAAFIEQYEDQAPAAAVNDRAVPRLKSAIVKKDEQDGTGRG
ncbi:alpha/beta hydrolase [Ramlibacter tataouinensis]|uniref:alpha/beta hydrolase n=1 Tax=Ramlibacter tataouinensis TaxID=94132 RepID=UPI0022F3B0C7|nr:alpha/beta hydrolase [Ramlibacter tataouinensis]WBY00672.1 alpha/beta hydrolase [Ramlibacter tataouinensis]